LLPPLNIDVKPLKNPPEDEEEEADASDEPGRENQLLLAVAVGAAVAVAACVGADAIGSKADPPLNLNVGSFGAVSLRILMVSVTGVGWTLKLTDVSSRLTNSTPSDFPTPGVVGGVPEIFR